MTAGNVNVGIAATASYLPERVMSAAEVASASGIPEGVKVQQPPKCVRRAQQWAAPSFPDSCYGS